MSENFYPASKEKLDKLRSEGIFALSHDLLSFFVAASFFLSTYYFLDTYLERFVTLFKRATLDGQSYLDIYPLFFKLLFDSTLIFLVPLGTVAIFAVLVQSRFLLLFPALRLRFDLVFAGFSKMKANYKKNILVFGFSLLKSSIVFYVLYFFLSQLIEVEILEYSSAQFLSTKASLLKSCAAAEAILSKLFFTVLVIMLIMALFSMLFSIIHFRKNHAMSKQEYLAELD